MNHQPRLESAKAMQSAFHVNPESVEDPELHANLGVYRWHTPPMEGFSLPESDDLVVALHLGGSRRVRSIGEQGLSRKVSMPGLVTVLPPGHRAAFHTDGSISLVTLHVPRRRFNSGVDRPQFQWCKQDARSFAFDDAYARASMEALLKVAHSGHAPSADYVPKLTDALLCHLSCQLGSGPRLADYLPGDDLPNGMLGCASLDQLLAYIDQRLDQRLVIDELALHTGLSRAGFSRAFRQLTGRSFHQYLIHRRIQRACLMLRRTSLGLACIAQELGFSNQSHFTAAFKAQIRCTPREYRDGLKD